MMIVPEIFSRVRALLATSAERPGVRDRTTRCKFVASTGGSKAIATHVVVHGAYAQLIEVHVLGCAGKGSAARREDLRRMRLEHVDQR